MLQDAPDGADAGGFGLGVVELLQRHGRQRLGILNGAGRRGGPVRQEALHAPEVLDVLAGEVGRELAGRSGGGEAGAGADDLQPVGRDPQARSQTAQEERDFRARRAAVQVRLVDDEEELLLRVGLQPGPCHVEDRPFQRAHEHVLEHRVVRDEDVRRRGQHLVAGQELGIVGAGDGADELAGPVLPVRSSSARTTP